MAHDDQPDSYVLTFDTTNPEFLRGFEAGLVWSHACYGGGLDTYVHFNNVEMVLRICETLDMPFKVDDIGEQLMHVRLGRALERED